METQTQTHTAMAREHRVTSASTPIGRLSAVTDVRVGLTTGAGTVTSLQPLDAVRAAVDEAGYDMKEPA